MQEWLLEHLRAALTPGEVMVYPSLSSRKAPPQTDHSKYVHMPVCAMVILTGRERQPLHWPSSAGALAQQELDLESQETDNLKDRERKVPTHCNIGERQGWRLTLGAPCFS